MIAASDQKQLDEIQFVLTGRTKPTLVVIETGTYRKRDELRGKVEISLPEYRHELLNLSGHTVTSLFRTIRETVPEDVLLSKPVECILHVYGLEDNLLMTANGLSGTSPLVRELNLERENLFHEFPFCLVIWTTTQLTDKLKKDAPDLWDWITYVYRFSDDRMPVSVSETPPLPELHGGLTDERKKRIEDLEQRLADLPLKGDTSERISRAKLTLYKALGKEYEAAFQIENAIRSYKAALSQTDDSGLGEDAKAEVYSQLGTACLRGRLFEDALKYMDESLCIVDRNQLVEKMGVVHHRIGIVYQEQRNWIKALESYQNALMWKEKTGMIHELGGTWHQIGRVHEHKDNVSAALPYYLKALECFIHNKCEEEQDIAVKSIRRIFPQLDQKQRTMVKDSLPEELFKLVTEV